MIQQRRLVGRVEGTAQVGIHQNHLGAQCQHACCVPAILFEIGIQQRGLGFVGHRAESVFDLAARTLGQHEEQRIGVCGPAGQVDHPSRRPVRGSRIGDPAHASRLRVPM